MPAKHERTPIASKRQQLNAFNKLIRTTEGLIGGIYDFNRKQNFDFRTLLGDTSGVKLEKIRLQLQEIQEALCLVYFGLEDDLDLAVKSKSRETKP